MHKKTFIGIITLIVALVSIMLEGFAFIQFTQYEKGFLQIYAQEQNGYVKTTLDQINRLGEDATEEKITEIIASLDATTSKYWMLSTENNILFIKSITETNRYKNYSADSYYSSESALEFINNMKENTVTDAIIELNDGRYVASGGIFLWQGQQYRICLLTYDKAILDQNILLETKNAIIIHLSLILILFLCTIIATAHIIVQKNIIIENHQNLNKRLNRNLEALDEQLKREIAYDANNHVFSMTVLPEFLEKLDKKDIYPLAFAYFEFDTRNIKEDFLKDMSVFLDRDVLRFDMGKLGVLLLLTGYTEERCRKMIREIDDWYISLKKWKFYEDNMISYTERFGEFWRD